jgi:bifunctional non-homologous end joining protein LigD
MTVATHRPVVPPMKAVMGELPADDAAWAYEVKWDGYRTIAFVDGSTVHLQSTKGIDVTDRYPELAELPSGVRAGSAVLDGEVVAFDDEGRPRFEHVQRHDRPVSYVVFDVLELDGRDTTALEYRERRRLLHDAVQPGNHWIVPKHREGGGAELLEATGSMGLEGVVAKRLTSTYQPGRRSPSWRKIKIRQRQELVIGGWTPGTGARGGRLGAVLVGYHDGGTLRFAGAVGSGFGDQELVELGVALDELAALECPFAPPAPAVASSPRWREIRRTARWVRPELVCEVAFAEWTAEGILRQPSYLGLRDDKDPHEVVRESP